MKNTFYLCFYLLVLIVFAVSCNGTSSISSVNEPLINTNGVYIAYNKNVSAFRKIGDSSIAINSIKVLRFTSQGKGIIIPESLTDSELLDTNKIRILYDWCLKYETKNPDDRNYIHIQPRFENDTIIFTQVASDSQILYKGINYKDSIKLTYKTIHQGKTLLNVKPKELNFKFYKLN